MNKKFLIKLSGTIAAAFSLFVLTAEVSAQSRGRENANGKGNVGSVVTGQRNVRPKTDNPVRRDFPNKPDRANQNHRRADAQDNPARNRPDNASNRPNGRYDAVGRRFGFSGEEFQSRFEQEKSLNPSLTFGQFVAAHSIARNLGSKHPGVTVSAILDGLRNGGSIGQTLERLGVSDNENRRQRKRQSEDAEDFEDDDDFEDDNDLD